MAVYAAPDLAVLVVQRRSGEGTHGVGRGEDISLQRAGESPYQRSFTVPVHCRWWRYQ